MTDPNHPVDPNAIRQKFLAFFAGKSHLVYPSASLKSGDPGLLFNVAGMQQFKPYFQGATPKFEGVEGVWRRVATAQKCMRAGGKDSDIENVGRTRRHHTFFEMLGNFSFGDYFKREAIAWAWEFLTSPEWLGLEPERLYATVFLDDGEAYDIWRDEVGLPEARLSRWGEAENFWPANAIKDERSGPCGPCSEIFYDRGPAYGSEGETGPNTGRGDRYLEIWNLVFTQFDLENGVLSPLPQQNIDTGMGLERLVTVVAGAPDAYATELFQPTIRKLAQLSGEPYRDLESVSHRVVADHLRAVTFAIADGILPANDGAGYVVKMLIRRAARHAQLLGLREPVLARLVPEVVAAMSPGYPELRGAETQVAGIVAAEETQFLRTLEAGTARVAELLDELDGEVLPGEVAFDLWETYGFPLDLTRDLAEERGVRVDQAGYEASRTRAREASRAGQGKGALFAASEGTLGELAARHGASEFVGYEAAEAEARVLALLRGGEQLSAAAEGDTVEVLLSRTPFYAEGGGQVGDAGKLEWPGGAALVSDTHKSPQGLYLHRAKVVRGRLEPGLTVTARVDPGRSETQKHHTATHLLHAALRSVLGEQVAQAGSLVAPERLRFDFSHPRALSAAEIIAVEALMNRWVQADFAVSWRVVPIAEARQAGAMMLFGEKYGERVRMVSVAPEAEAEAVSLELCGGTHVGRTGEIGLIAITAEEAVSAGVRRVEAVAGLAALRYLQLERQNLNALARQLGSKPEEALARVEKLQSELKAAQREVERLQDKLVAAQTQRGAQLREAGGYRYLASTLEGLDAGALRNAADALLAKSGADVVVLASGPLLVAKTSEAARERGAHAGNLIRELAKRAGGGGGGRPDLAQAGVKDAGRVAEALEALPELLVQG